MSTLAPCPKCNSEYSYVDGTQLVCPECGHEWPADAATDSNDDAPAIKDSVGNLLQDGDTITVIKDLKVTDRRFNRMRPSIAPRKRHQAG